MKTYILPVGAGVIGSNFIILLTYLTNNSRKEEYDD